MKLPHGAAMIDTGRALLALARTTVLFRLRRRSAVARATRRAMALQPHLTPGRVASEADLWRAWRAVRRAKRLWPAPVLCLQTALVTHELLRARRIAAVVRLGVRQEDGALHAHAWIEAGGRMLDDGPADTTFVTLGPPGNEADRVLAGEV